MCDKKFYFFQLLIVTALSAESIALRVQQGTRSSPVSEDRIDLVPPKFESISQYNQPQTLSQLLNIHQHSFIQPIVQQQGPITPFLYLGPLIYSNNPRPQQQLNRQQENQEENSRADHEQENTYVIYRPSAEEEHELVDLAPPPAEQEPNYYSLKPRKFKKYQEAEDKKNLPKSIEDLKKRIKIAEIESADDELEQPHNLNSEEIHRSLSENIRAARDLLTAASDDDYEIKESPPTSRLDFQMHGN